VGEARSQRPTRAKQSRVVKLAPLPGAPVPDPAWFDRWKSPSARDVSLAGQRRQLGLANWERDTLRRSLAGFAGRRMTPKERARVARNIAAELQGEHEARHLPKEASFPSRLDDVAFHGNRTHFK